MSNTPVICIAQEPNGFFPTSSFVAKLKAARKLQKDIGGKIVWFVDDSESNYKSTEVILVDKKTGQEIAFNFIQENEIQKNFSPLYAKRIAKNWQEDTAQKLVPIINSNLLETFKSVKSDTSAGFCIRMYQKLGLLDEVEIIRSSDPAVRRSAIPVPDFFIDTEYQNEIVRARFRNDHLELGATKLILPLPGFDAETISPALNLRFTWMQSVVNCSHYIFEKSEKDLLNLEQYPAIRFTSTLR